MLQAEKQRKGWTCSQFSFSLKDRKFLSWKTPAHVSVAQTHEYTLKPTLARLSFLFQVDNDQSFTHVNGRPTTWDLLKIANYRAGLKIPITYKCLCDCLIRWSVKPYSEVVKLWTSGTQTLQPLDHPPKRDKPGFWPHPRVWSCVGQSGAWNSAFLWLHGCRMLLAGGTTQEDPPIWLLLGDRWLRHWMTETWHQEGSRVVDTCLHLIVGGSRPTHSHSSPD